jgi:DNA invertase Pin-like site-specific DNA recombinase
MLHRTFDPHRPHRFVRYARMSSDQQNARSPEQQFDTIDHLISRLNHPWVHVRDYRDDGISGRYLRKRHGFQEMLRDIQTGTTAVDLILVDTAERLGRVEELTAIRQGLYNRHGVLVLTADSQFADPTTVSGKALAIVETLRATEDGRIKAHNVLRGKRDAARSKHWPGGPAPFGYRLHSILVDRHGRQEVDYCILVPDAATAWIIQRLFHRADETGWGTPRLARSLNADPEIPEAHKPFYPDTIGYWLSNPIYYGELLWEEHATGIVNDTRVIERNAEEDMVRVPDYCDPLVTRELWESVATLRRARSQAHRRRRETASHEPAKQIAPVVPGRVLKYLLTGLIRCGECNRSMRPIPSGQTSKAGKRYVYYTCPGMIAGVCRNKKQVREDWLRHVVVARLRDRLFPSPGQMPCPD